MKPYAVVSFINDSSAEFESASEVPSSWLSADLTKCWWPNTKNVTPLISRKVTPDKESPKKWQLYHVKVIGYYDNLSMARQKADGLSMCSDNCEEAITLMKSQQSKSLKSIQEEGEPAKHRKKRSKVQRRKKEDCYSSSDEMTEAVDENSNIASPPQLSKIDSGAFENNNFCSGDLSGKNLLPVKTSANKGIVIQSNIPVSLNISQNKTAMEKSHQNQVQGQIFASGNVAKWNERSTNVSANDPNKDINNISFPLDASIRDYFIDPKLVSEQFEELKEIMKNTAERVGGLVFEMRTFSERLDLIEQTLANSKQMVAADDDYADLKTLLPLDTTEHILEFEAHLTVGDLRNRFISLMCQTGGNSAKDCIIRMLNRVIGPTAAKASSWCGLRGNFRVGNLEIMSAIKDAVKKTHTCTDKQFEDEAKEWFRQGTQKYARLVKNAKPNSNGTKADVPST